MTHTFVQKYGGGRAEPVVGFELDQRSRQQSHRRDTSLSTSRCSNIMYTITAVVLHVVAIVEVVLVIVVIVVVVVVVVMVIVVWW